jgi:hypothetical protein
MADRINTELLRTYSYVLTYSTHFKIKIKFKRPPRQNLKMAGRRKWTLCGWCASTWKDPSVDDDAINIKKPKAKSKSSNHHHHLDRRSAAMV